LKKLSGKAGDRYLKRESITIKPEVLDIDRKIKIVRSGIRTAKDYDEHLLHITELQKS